MAIILAETCQRITEYVQIFKKDNKNDVANCRLFFKKYNRLLWRQCSLSIYCLKNPCKARIASLIFQYLWYLFHQNETNIDSLVFILCFAFCINVCLN